MPILAASPPVAMTLMASTAVTLTPVASRLVAPASVHCRRCNAIGGVVV